MPQFGHTTYRVTAGLDDPVPGPQPGATGRRIGPAGRHDGGSREWIARAVADPDDARRQRFPRLKPGENSENVLQRHGETDPGVVQLRSRHHPRGFSGKRSQHPDHPALEIDKRPPVIRRRDGGIGLDRPPPGPIGGREDPHPDTRLARTPSPSQDERALSDRESLTRHCLRHRQRRHPRGQINFEKHETAGEIATGHPGHMPGASRERDHGLGRILGHGKRGRHHPAFSAHDEPTRRSRCGGGLGRPTEPGLGDSRHLDPDHGRRYCGGRRPEDFLLLEPHAVGVVGHRMPSR